MKKLIAVTALLFFGYFAFSQQPLFRYYNSKIRKHYYTTDFNEFANGRGDWNFEGTSCMVFTRPDRDQGIVPLFRYLNNQTGDHYYTTNRRMFGDGANGYTLEGAECAIFKFRAPGTIPLFEYYNPQTGDHFYTADRTELGRGFEGYNFNTKVGFVYPPR